MPKKFTFQHADHIPFLNEGTFPHKHSHKNSTINFFFFSGGQELLKLVKCKMHQLVSACNRVHSLLFFLMEDRRDNTQQRILQAYIFYAEIVLNWYRIQET